MTVNEIVGEDQIKVRILIDCYLGSPNDVVVIDAATAKSLKGLVDPDPAAVAYAESLAAGPTSQAN